MDGVIQFMKQLRAGEVSKLLCKLGSGIEAQSIILFSKFLHLMPFEIPGVSNHPHEPERGSWPYLRYVPMRRDTQRTGITICDTLAPCICF